MRPNHTIVRFQDGRVIKGYTYNLNPGKYHFHLFPVGDAAAKGTEVWLRDVKAVFFTRDLTGDPDHQERKAFADEERPGYRKVRVTFADGEMLCGYTTRYDSGANGFYFVPADAASNNLRVFAVFAGIREIAYLGSGDGEAGAAVAPLPALPASATA